MRDPERAVLELAAGKETNLRIAAAALDGIVVRPREVLSMWFAVGAPTAERGFERGMELRSGCIVPTVGGGLCQIAGGLFEAALRAGLTVVEHHPHSLELAPEPDRIRPFGTGAAVLYPYRDVLVRNDHPFDVVLRADVGDETLRIDVLAERLPFVVSDVEERNYRVERLEGRLYRAAELWRVWRRRDSGTLVRETIVLAGRVPVLEEMPDSHCYTCDKTSCPSRYAEGTRERAAAMAEHERARTAAVAASLSVAAVHRASLGHAAETIAGRVHRLRVVPA